MLINKWVFIEYIGEGGKVNKAYFKMRRLVGNTEELFLTLKAIENRSKENSR